MFIADGYNNPDSSPEIQSYRMLYAKLPLKFFKVSYNGLIPSISSHNINGILSETYSSLFKT